MHRGYVKLWRRLLASELWTQEKFTRGQAWVDLILLANHKPGSIRVRGARVSVARGQLGYSELSLAKRWKWSRGKVRRFMSELASNPIQQIEQQKTSLTSLISIVNYDQYQGDGQRTEHQTVQQTDIKRYTNKNVKNVKNKDMPFEGSKKGPLYQYISCNHCQANASNIHRGQECPYCGKVVE